MFGLFGTSSHTQSAYLQGRLLRTRNSARSLVTPVGALSSSSQLSTTALETPINCYTASQQMATQAQAQALLASQPPTASMTAASRAPLTPEARQEFLSLLASSEEDTDREISDGGTLPRQLLSTAQSGTSTAGQGQHRRSNAGYCKLSERDGAVGGVVLLPGSQLQ